MGKRRFLGNSKICWKSLRAVELAARNAEVETASFLQLEDQCASTGLLPPEIDRPFRALAEAAPAAQLDESLSIATEIQSDTLSLCVIQSKNPPAPRGAFTGTYALFR